MTHMMLLNLPYRTPSPTIQNAFPYDIAPLLTRLEAMEAAYAEWCEDDEEEDDGTEQLISGLALLQSAYTDSSDEE